MAMPTMLSVSAVSELFFSHIKELSVQSLRELKDGRQRAELRLVRGFRDFSELQSTSTASRLVRA
ncbi:hypothetical protein HYU16_04635 [Candidatus Woesearchaeota archaeon]|nr:hypothetical protein [Candidatus Woesearchaeota archaeon]